ncbi:tyrosine-type recombinase/integrase [Natronorubrum sulfidifaciens]|uniref:Integrase domain-containing protein SAM domain-containing protein n=1 Tax=Natronorubrum sulfidifaciens JCM 14089 TaxID=1230460 RepID=L9WEE3_9EURY|nr:site-specific integrase [Natronorubrum sulfidifaciens]ELY46678.1 integrase domain-containing protein SAM domain-containing protein [Natronorubrum sulfidifaciens JCM 14089]
MSDTDSMNPEEAVELYLKDRETDLSRQSHQSHQYRLKGFLEWCETQGVEDMNSVTGRTTHRYKIHEQQRVKATTLKGYMDTLRVFLRFCEQIDAVADGVAESTVSPTVSKGDSTRDAIVTADRANTILAHHSKYEYAKLHHAFLKLLFETGMRMGAAQSIDLTDTHTDAQYIELRHRPHTDTTLKNAERGERTVSISPGLSQVLQDYIDTHRHDVEDNGRKPLLTTDFGRIKKSTMRQEMYRLTRPCTYGIECPHDRIPDECEGMKSRTPYKCPSSEAPHAVRRGAITHYLSEDTPARVISDRMDVSEDVLDEHYDARDETSKMQQRREHLPF